MHTIYVADDGTQFDYEWDCEIYEAKQTFVGKQYPTLINRRGDDISIEDILDNAIYEIHLIFAHNKEEMKNLYELFVWCGCAYSDEWKHIATNTSSWIWDDSYGQWENLDDQIFRYERLKAIRDTYLKGE